MLPSLVDEFSLKGAEVTEILVKVQPSYVAPQHSKRTKQAAPIAASAKHDLSRLAEELPADSPLKEALARLVTRSR
jgi:hypothetical protein